MSIISIDRGKKRLWIAYTTDASIIFPLWSLDNDQNVLYWLAHIIAEHKATIIVVGYPSQQSYVQKSIDTFIKELSYVIDPTCTIVKENEDYTSVQAGELLWTYKKTAAEDSLAAAKILENYLKIS